MANFIYDSPYCLQCSYSYGLGNMNAVAYIFFAPFYLAKGIWQTLCLIPMPYRIIPVVVVIIGLVVASLSEAGPFRLAAIFRRFSWIGIPIGMLVIWWLWCAFLFLRFPDYDSWAVMVSGWFLLCVLVWMVAVDRVLLRGHLNKGILHRAYRRMRFRLRWDSIAKSCGMAHERDVRPHDWTTGGTTIIRMRALSVQWVPILWHGRRGADDTTQYLIQPARGLSAKHWTDPKDGSTANDLTMAIAIAAGAKNCSISKSDRDNWWILTMFWTDPSNYRPRLED